MSSQSIIQVEGLAKKYVLGGRGGGEGPRYRTLRDTLADSVGALFRQARAGAPAVDPPEFWALRDVSFEVKPGEVVGVIGRNGAGKSTLLKVLSRITEPTQGRVTLNGRVASLLEVGTGFHPELTGRENIYLNGAILGMSRKEIRSKFDEIVAFAEVEQFLDTPVKRYSSGMYVRLAFAVAAHLDPEILVVDEVLAVGDAEFQKKCLGKMKDVAQGGRTVLLVSHQMASIAALATSCILLHQGKIVQSGPTQAVLRKYSGADGLGFLPEFFSHKTNGVAWISRAALINAEGQTTSDFKAYEDIILEIDWINQGAVPTIVGFQMNNLDGVVIMTAYDTPSDWDGSAKRAGGAYRTRTVIPKNLLPAQDYTLHLALDSASPRLCFDVHHDALRFSVHDPMDEHCITRGALKNPLDYMAVLPALEWRSTHGESGAVSAATAGSSHLLSR